MTMRGRVAKRTTELDLHIAARLRALRVAHGISQAGLGQAIGVSFQQIQKYERAADRIGAANLYALARTLNVEIEAFFETFADGRMRENNVAPRFVDISAIPNTRVQASLLKLVATLSR